MPAFLPKLSSLLLATSLLVTGACSSATRSASDAGVARAKPIHAIKVQPRAAEIDRAALRAKLRERREQSVARFLAYREARVYPINTVTPGLQHIWVDELGHLCAAATIISADWGYDQTVAAANGDNFIRLADVTDGALAEWMLTSGLAHHEIVAIQEPMEGGGNWRAMQMPEPDPTEQARLYAIYVSVERQISSLADESLELAVDALAAHPDLARRFLAGELAGEGGHDA